MTIPFVQPHSIEMPTQEEFIERSPVLIDIGALGGISWLLETPVKLEIPYALVDKMLLNDGLFDTVKDNICPKYFQYLISQSPFVLISS